MDVVERPSVLIYPPSLPPIKPLPKEKISNGAFNGWHADDLILFAKLFSSPLLTNGFFLEMGALDGDDGSNTLFFEENLGWTGVLIEPNAPNFQKLVKRRYGQSVVIIVQTRLLSLM